MNLGSDPEFLLTDGSSFVSAIDKLPRRKKGLEMFQDNVAAELNIPPRDDCEAFLYEIRKGICNLAKTIRPLKIAKASAAEYPPQELMNPLALEIACEGEWCAYHQKEIPQPKDKLKNNLLRCAGGHIHVGGRESLIDRNNKFRMVRLMDLFVGIPLTILEGGSRRVELYGQAGSHRVPPYGVEYRTPSNYWLSSPKTARLVWKLCSFCCDALDSGKYEEYWDHSREKRKGECIAYDHERLIEAISTQNIEECEFFMELAEKELPDDIRGCFRKLRDCRISGNIPANWGIECDD